MSRGSIFSSRLRTSAFLRHTSNVNPATPTSDVRVQGMAARVTPYPTRILRGRQSVLPVPPAHRGAMLSSLIWSLSTPSASLPYHKPNPCPSAPAFSQVIKRGMATAPKLSNVKMQDSDDEALARFHRAVRDESESYIDMWSLPLETLGASAFVYSVISCFLPVVGCDLR